MPVGAFPASKSPGIPIDRLTALRNAFEATTNDPEFIADATRIQLELNPVSGEEIDILISRIYDASENAVSLASKAIVKSDGM